MKREFLFDYNWLALKIHNDFFRKIVQRLTGVVIDLGSGSQGYRWDIERSGCQYLAIDWMHSLHRAKPAVIADLNRGLGLRDCYADNAICFSVMEHLHRPECMLAEAHRVLKPGGWLYLQVPFQWGVHEHPYDYLRFTRYGLQTLLQEAGFDRVTIQADCGFWVTMVLKSNYHSRRLIRGPRLVRRLVELFFRPAWALLQLLALVGDRIDLDVNETASYTVCARRPPARCAGAES